LTALQLATWYLELFFPALSGSSFSRVQRQFEMAVLGGILLETKRYPDAPEFAKRMAAKANPVANKSSIDMAILGLF